MRKLFWRVSFVAVLTAVGFSTTFDSLYALPNSYKAGERVARPAGYGDKWLESVVIAVDLSQPFPYRIHPLGYLDTMDESFTAQMLRPMGSVRTEPVGGIKDDPWLMKLTGAKPFQPAALHKGKYECWTSSGGRLQSAMILNFEVLDAHRYRDVKGHAAKYRFDPKSATLVFQGGTLNGQKANYEQASNPPTAGQPPTVTFQTSGDQCQLSL